MKNVAVIGGGPAGMMAAISAAKAGAQVTLYEKNEKLGKKLYITGKGRCNVTNACETQEFFSNVVHNEKFLYSAFYSFTNTDAQEFLSDAGLPLKIERGNRVFPASDRASDVTRTLESEMKRYGVRVKLNSKVRKIADLSEDAVIVATGGLSYPSTGSTGDGYEFAKKEGHRIEEPMPSLCPLTVREDFISRLEGLSLKNVTATIRNGSGQSVFEEFGEMLFTHNGVSGPIILSASAILSRSLGKLKKDENFELLIDLKPALSEKDLDARVLRDFGEVKNKNFSNSLGKLLPSKLIPVIVQLSGIDPYKKVNEITKNERLGLIKLLKGFKLTVNGTGGFSQAVITSGGVSVKDVNPKTMESKLKPGLFFAGEVLDLDALTGGFNIQIALSTGYLAGMSAAKEKGEIK